MGRNTLHSTHGWTTEERDSKENKNGVGMSRAAQKKPMELVWVKEPKRKSTNRAPSSKPMEFVPIKELERKPIDGAACSKNMCSFHSDELKHEETEAPTEGIVITERCGESNETPPFIYA